MIIPNTFMTPNDYVDRCMAHLTGDEYKVLSFAVRHILGWQDRIASREATISLSMFQDGYTTASGRRYEGTGLSRPTIVAALRTLQAVRLLVRTGITQKGGVYTLAEEPDWALMHELGDRRRAAAARPGRTASTGKRGLPAGSKPDLPAGSKPDLPEVVSPVYQGSKPDLPAVVNAAYTNKAIAKPEEKDIAKPARAGAREAAAAAGGTDIEIARLARLYESAFGFTVTVMALDDMQELARQFSEEWLADALHETAQNNAKSLKYTRAILNRWKKDGRAVSKAGIPVAQAPAGMAIDGDTGRLVPSTSKGVDSPEHRALVEGLQNGTIKPRIKIDVTGLPPGQIPDWMKNQ